MEGTAYPMNGALLINKEANISSFGVIGALQRQWIECFGGKKRDVPKMGHGGTLDPFATGLLIVLVGRGVKLSRYFLDSVKGYDGTLRFGETTVPGDPTAPISERCEQIPQSLDQIREQAYSFTQEPYLQIPPMHSAKKLNGKPLYELARQGIEVDRAPKRCHLYSFEVLNYNPPHADFTVECSSGTYVRTLGQDLAKKLGTLALLDRLHRTRCGAFSVQGAQTLGEIANATKINPNWEDLPCWVPFDHLLASYPQIEASREERNDLFNGKQSVLPQILERCKPETGNLLMIYHEKSLIAVVRKPSKREPWLLERVFLMNESNPGLKPGFSLSSMNERNFNR